MREPIEILTSAFICTSRIQVRDLAYDFQTIERLFGANEGRNE